jgi:hypothetical protein
MTLQEEIEKVTGLTIKELSYFSRLSPLELERMKRDKYEVFEMFLLGAKEKVRLRKLKATLRFLK